MKNKYYKVSILNNEYWVYVCIGKDYEELAKKLSRYFKNKYDSNLDPENFKDIVGETFRKSDYHPYIFINLNNCKTENCLYATLAHEACHAVDDIFNAIGDNNRDELFAHSVEAVIRGFNSLK